MVTRGEAETLNKSTRRVMQFSSAGFGVVLTLYSFLIFAGLAPHSQHYVGQYGAIIICLVSLLYGVIQIGHPTSTKRASNARYVYFYILLAIFLLFVSGFASPVAYLWAVVIVSSYLYFGLRGSVTCVLLLASISFIDTILSGFAPTMIAANGTTLFVICSVGATIVLAMHGARVDQREVDVSRAQAFLQQNRLTTLINNLADAIISVDTTGEITLYNAAALNLLDTNTTLENQYLDDILKITDTNKKSVSLVHELLRSTSSFSRDDLILSTAGETLRLEVVCSKIRGGYDAPLTDELGGYIIILRDITKSKSLEEERDEFISVVSHELRTPITIAEGTISNAQLMLQRGNTAPDKITEAVATAHDQVVFLARMVNDLSTLSRAERGVADTAEEIDLKEIVHDLYTEYASEAEKKDLQIDLHMPTQPGRVIASRLYLKELLQNFVTNAIKYTKKGTITLDVHRDRAGYVTIAVKDSGIGISKSDQKRIFEKFYRAEDYRTRETNGTGLGLYVAQKLAHKLGVRIELKSRLNHGSTFSITLPIIEITKSRGHKN